MSKTESYIKSINNRLTEGAKNIHDITDYKNFLNSMLGGEKKVVHQSKNGAYTVDGFEVRMKKVNGKIVPQLRNTKENRKQSSKIRGIHNRTHAKGKSYKNMYKRINKQRDKQNDFEMMYSALYDLWKSGEMTESQSNEFDLFRLTPTYEEVKTLYDKIFGSDNTLSNEPPETFENVDFLF